VYGGQHVFLPDDACATSGIAAGAASLDIGTIVPEAHDYDREIVWVTHAGVAGVPRSKAAMDTAFEHIQAASASADVRRTVTETFGSNQWDHATFRKAERDQVAFAGKEKDAMEIMRIHSSDAGLFLSVPRQLVLILDTLLPPHIVPVGVAPHPVSFGYDIPEKYAKHLAEVTRKLRFDAELSAVVNTISPAAIKKDVRYLTGEDSDIVSRHSFTEGARVAAKWIKSEV
jgi:hypothetical protein